jgi:hypothetical protein
MTIKWGEISFDGPYPITKWDPPRKAAVYVIMMPGKEKGYYKLIYVGETENLSDRGFYKSHHAYDCWIKEAGNESKLSIGIHAMPGSTKDDRLKIEQQIKSKYSPACNK